MFMMHWLRCLGTVLGVHPRGRSLSTSGSGFEIINASRKVDEERLPHYKPSHFYPVYLRDIFESRYQVLSKLGYGSCSTVWLSHDMMSVIFRITHIRVNKSIQQAEVRRAESLYVRLSEYRARTCCVCTSPQSAQDIHRILGNFTFTHVPRRI